MSDQKNNGNTDDRTTWVERYELASTLERLELNQEWEAAGHRITAWLNKNAPDLVDSWQRLYRLPRATRDGGSRPENHASWGDPERIGVLHIKATHDDIEAAQHKTSAFRNRSREMNFSAPGRVDSGVLFWLLRNRGDLGSEAARGGWICRCPNRAQHSIASDGTDSTVVYPAKDGGVLGAVHCKHAHCQRFTPKDWLTFFSDFEIESARRAAGVVSRDQRGRAGTRPARL